MKTTRPKILPEPIRVLYLSAEAVPFVKVGGLGDVAGSLPKSLLSYGSEKREQPEIDIRVVIPFYPMIDPSKFNLVETGTFFMSKGKGSIRVDVFHCMVQNVPFYFISGEPIRSTRLVYSSDPSMDGKKFVFFSLAALEWLQQLNWKPDIIHANDWHTAPAILKVFQDRRKHQGGTFPCTVLTVHNLPYLGEGTSPALEEFGLVPNTPTGLPGWAATLPLPLGLYAADKITTVSPGYAKEIQTEPFGVGLHRFIKGQGKLVGILNGIDVEYWDPGTDPFLVENYRSHSIEKRQWNKSALQAEFRLERSPDIPLLAVISRLDYQKGVDIAIDALQLLIDSPWQVVILGLGDPAIENLAQRFQKEHSDRVCVINRFDQALGNRLYASADINLIPSRYEPCGLTQMIAMRYGSVPVARSTGGLADTIKDYHSSSTPTGFLVDGDRPSDFFKRIQLALKVFEDKSAWRKLQLNGMNQDFSWKQPAQQYIQLYRTLLAKRNKDQR